MNKEIDQKALELEYKTEFPNPQYKERDEAIGAPELMSEEEIELSKKLAALPMPYFEWMLRMGACSEGLPGLAPVNQDILTHIILPNPADFHPDLHDDATAGVLLGLLRGLASRLGVTIRIDFELETNTDNDQFLSFGLWRGGKFLFLFTSDHLGVAVAKAWIALSEVGE